ncbi:MAG: phosphate ABC transporter substrate-binding protein, partial [Catenulispora sp.]|nr:phosphate ABC transporter substrate-binding protein [Catenulispora sp.]
MTSPLTSRRIRRPIRRLPRRLTALLLATAATLAPVTAAAPARADGFVPIGGDGSSWSQNAMTQWQADVAGGMNMKVNYAGNGSTVGRQAFAAGTVDFAVSEIPYGVVDNGSADVPPTGTHPFKYLPIVAGGTAFMYHLDSGGKRITNLRLDDVTVAKIFTGNLSFWDDPEIKRENPGIPLPHRQIVPVVRSDGSGTTAQLTTWFDKQPNLSAMWAAYCSANGRAVAGGHCGTTSFFPASGKFVSLNGSTGVSGYVASEPGEGAITYVEYSYAQNQKFPVVKLLNKSGYYIAPNALNVAVALTNVRIDDQLLQHLEDVYNSSDARAYPLSSYSYMIVPTSTNSPFSTAKGNTLGAFIQYFLCQGQQHVDLLGYSPLPLNLVQAGLDVTRSIPGANVTTTPSSCANPTVSSTGHNKLAEIAPQPAPCDRQGTSQCAADGVTPVPGGGTTGGRTTGGTASGGTSGGTTGGGTGGGTTGGGIGT